MAAVLAVMLTSLEIEKCLMGELCFGCNPLKTNLIKKRNIFLKPMIKKRPSFFRFKALRLN